MACEATHCLPPGFPPVLPALSASAMETLAASRATLILLQGLCTCLRCCFEQTPPLKLPDFLRCWPQYYLLSKILPDLLPWCPLLTHPHSCFLDCVGLYPAPHQGHLCNSDVIHWQIMSPVPRKDSKYFGCGHGHVSLCSLPQRCVSG